MAFADNGYKTFSELKVADLRETVKGLRKQLTEEREAHKAALESCRREYARRVKAEAKLEKILEGQKMGEFR